MAPGAGVYEGVRGGEGEDLVFIGGQYRGGIWQVGGAGLNGFRGNLSGLGGGYKMET